MSLPLSWITLASRRVGGNEFAKVTRGKSNTTTHHELIDTCDFTIKLYIWGTHLEFCTSSLNASNPHDFWSKQPFYIKTHWRARNNSVSKITCLESVRAWVQISRIYIETRQVGLVILVLMCGDGLGRQEKAQKLLGCDQQRKHPAWNRVESKDWLLGLCCDLKMHHGTDGDGSGRGERETEIPCPQTTILEGKTSEQISLKSSFLRKLSKRKANVQAAYLHQNSI